MRPDPAAPAPLGAIDLVDRAREALRANDRGGYTVPSPALYPFQWNWDSAVVALGWMSFDEPRAWRELESLLSGQWENGLLPHIIFHRPSASYFPGPAEWGLTHRSPPTSSITQPPLLATIVRTMRARAIDRALADEACAKLLPKIVAWHHWWYRDRDPANTGLVACLHPWETGMDNSPAWDEALTAVPRATRPYQRKDTSHVAAAQRPEQSDYDRFVYLLDLFRDLKFDAAALYRESPFRVADFGTNAILLRATEDLAALCTEFSVGAAAELTAHALHSRAALAGLWSESLGQYVSQDLRTGRLLASRTHSTFLAWYAGLSGTPEREAILVRQLDDWLASARFGLASTHPLAPEYNPSKYWRGPIWPHINWLAARGLAERGHAVVAETLRRQTAELIERGGLREYFHPDTGEAYGGDQFAWTAAVVLFWTSQGASR